MVYQAVNLKNGKRYIGVTSKSLDARRKQHFGVARRGIGNHPFAKAIRKYGAEAFEWSILLNGLTAKEALDYEMEIIKASGRKALYNITSGGPGQLGRPMSADGRKRVGEYHKGKQWRLGMPHTEETKARLREVGLSQKGEWLKRSHLGPMASSKRVVCLDDGKIYDSASAAGRAYDIPRSQIIEVCLRREWRRTAGNLVFRYEGDHNGGKAEADAERAKRYANKCATGLSQRKRVVCVNDGREFPSTKEAAEVYGLSKTFISEICRGVKRSSEGYVFRYVGKIDGL